MMPACRKPPPVDHRAVGGGTGPRQQIGSSAAVWATLAGLTLTSCAGTIEQMFDPSQLDLAAQAVLLREVAALLAAGIGIDTSGQVAAVLLDELLAASRQVDLATVQAI